MNKITSETKQSGTFWFLIVFTLALGCFGGCSKTPLVNQGLELLHNYFHKATSVDPETQTHLDLYVYKKLNASNEDALIYKVD